MIHKKPKPGALAGAAGPRKVALLDGIGSEQNSPKPLFLQAVRLARLPFDHPERVAVRRLADARGRMLRAVWSFNDLEPLEQTIFADGLAKIMRAGEPTPPFGDMDEHAADWAAWADVAELRAYHHAVDAEVERRFGQREALRRRLADIWQRLPDPDRMAFLVRVTGEHGGA